MHLSAALRDPNRMYALSLPPASPRTGHDREPQTPPRPRRPRPLRDWTRACLSCGGSGGGGKSRAEPNFSNGYNFAPIVWALGGGSIYINRSAYSVDWYDGGDGFIYYTITGTYDLHYRDAFSEPVDIPGLEWGTPYAYYDSWLNQSVFLEGRIAE